MLMYQNKIFFRVGLVVGMAFSTHWAPIQVFRLVVGPTYERMPCWGDRNKYKNYI